MARFGSVQVARFTLERWPASERYARPTSSEYADCCVLPPYRHSQKETAIKKASAFSESIEFRECPGWEGYRPLGFSSLASVWLPRKSRLPATCDRRPATCPSRSNLWRFLIDRAICNFRAGGRSVGISTRYAANPNRDCRAGWRRTSRPTRLQKVRRSHRRSLRPRIPISGARASIDAV